MIETTKKIVAVLCMTAGLWSTCWAADPPASSQPAELAKLKAQLEEQQKMIDQLRAAIEEQKKMLERAGIGSATQAATPQHTTPAAGLVASTTPMVPPVSAAPAAAPAAPKFDPPAPQAAAATTTAPLQIRIGDVGITPVGFMDATGVWKSKNAGGSIGTNFGSIPYNNVATSKLSEFRFSPQNSRLGFRVDGDVKGWHFIAYNEFDFLGTSGGNNLSVTNGAFVPRLRLFWVDVRKNKFEFLAGQSWSMLTPNRRGISALPGDLFYSQVIDVNYMAGLTWTRQPVYRVLYHPSNQVTMGFSAENPEQYMGGSAGGSTIVLPTALTGLAGTQLDNNTNVQTIPNLHPDFIGKVAFDPSARAHFEIAGIERTFRIWNITTGQPNSGKYSNLVGGGGSVNGNFEVVKNLRLITNNYWSSGGGRYLFGQAPDVVVSAAGTLSPIHSGGTVDGFEATVKNTLLYAYYGAIYIKRNVVVDTNGSLVGYGYRGSSNSQNRAIQEFSCGFNQTIWRDAKYGALNFMGQYMYLTRNPWYVAVGSPKAANLNTLFFNLRYTLPGVPPPPK
jgi:hypothetical protein